MNAKRLEFSKNILVIKDIEAEIARITDRIRQNILFDLKRKGAVVGISGGIDSSVSLALAAKALGPDKVLGIMLPEKESSSNSVILARELAEKFGVDTLVEDISEALKGFGCYKRRDEAVKRVFPDFDPQTYKCKIGIHQTGIKQNLPPVFYLTIISPSGEEHKKVIPLKEYLQIVAASNFKQRSRMAMLYYHAESLHYAVVGTANKHEIEQGFFVKHGDGGVDLMPIGYLYKTQIYQVAAALGIPESIIKRPPTTDTYSAEQTQEEFFFQLPFKDMDLLWYAFENGYPVSEVAPEMNLSEKEAEHIYANFTRKQRTTEYLRKSAEKM